MLLPEAQRAWAALDRVDRAAEPGRRPYRESRGVEVADRLRGALQICDRGQVVHPCPITSAASITAVSPGAIAVGPAVRTSRRSVGYWASHPRPDTGSPVYPERACDTLRIEQGVSSGLKPEEPVAALEDVLRIRPTDLPAECGRAEQAIGRTPAAQQHVADRGRRRVIDSVVKVAVVAVRLAPAPSHWRRHRRTGS